MTIMTTKREITRGEKEVLTTINRRLYDEFPELRRTLIDPLRRNALHNLLIHLLKYAPEHTLAQCVVRVSREGYTVSVATGDEPREPGTTRGSDVAEPTVLIRPGSQLTRLLGAFWDAGDPGLTADEARERSGVPERSCYWKRVSELHAAGYIERLEDADGTDVHRQGDAGSPQRVYRITPFGLEAIEATA